LDTVRPKRPSEARPLFQWLLGFFPKVVKAPGRGANDIPGPQLRKIGNYKFENFETIPLCDVFIEVVVDPKIVARVFPWLDGGDRPHWKIKACKQEKPCKE